MNRDNIQIKLCCGCGNVNLSIGSTMIKISKSELIELSTKLDKLLEDLNESSAQSEPMHLFADRKFFA